MIDGLDVEQRHGRADTDPESVDRTQDELLGDLVARLKGPQPDAAREPVATALLHDLEEHRRTILRELACALLERTAACVRLDAPVEPAVAAEPSGARADVADLTGRAASVQRLPVDDDPTPDAGAPEDTEERIESPAGAEATLGLDGDVDVVPDRHGPPELLGERGAERVWHIPPLDVRHLDDGPGLDVDRARRADTDGGEAHRLDARHRPAPHAAPRRARRPPHRARRAAASRAAPCRAPSPRRRSRPPGSSFRRGRVRLASASRQPPHDLLERLAVRPLAPFRRRFAGSGRAASPGSPNERTMTGVSSRAASSARRAASASAMPFGQDASPSAHAARRMLWAARPASKETGPLPVTRIAITRPAPRTFSGT